MYGRLAFLALLTLFTRCTPEKKQPGIVRDHRREVDEQMSDTHHVNPLDDCLGKLVTLRGIAENNPEGAVLVGNGFDIIVETVRTWPKEAADKEVLVTGKCVLKKYFRDPVISQGRYVTPGIFGES